MEDECLSHLEQLLDCLPGVREGDADAIHDARVAIRRLRAAVPMLEATGALEQPATFAGTLKSAGKALGAARDVDVAIDLLTDIERRSPPTAPAAATLRAHLIPLQARRRRQLIKRLESADIDTRVREVLRSTNGAASRVRPRRAARALTERLGGHIDAVATAVTHATGVYFPNRAHGVRVAVKKLRYLVELLDERDPARRPALRSLKRAQQTLGRLHDREVLSRRLDKVERAHEVPAARALSAVLEAEVRDLFEKYRAARTELLATCTALTVSARAITRSSLPIRMLKAGAVAVPSAAILLMASRRRLVS
jgi:CHAD domain-containing protein